MPKIGVSELKDFLEEAKREDSAICRMFGRGPIFTRFHYDDLDSEGKIFLATTFLEESCYPMGGPRHNFEMPHFLRCFAGELPNYPYNDFSHRRRPHIGFAINAICDDSGLYPGNSLQAISATYLIVQLEALLRVIASEYLNFDGTWRDVTVRDAASQTLKHKFGTRVNQIEWTYRIMLLSANPTAAHFRALETRLPKVHTYLGELKDIGARLSFLRNMAAHGPASDISSEGHFYALLVAIIQLTSSVL